MSIRNPPNVTSSEDWLAARKDLLVKEKKLTEAHDRLNADRRRLPMVRLDKPYTFEGPDGVVGLGDLFDGRPQLVMHHFMWLFDIEPDGTERPRDHGCASCSSAADGISEHLRQLHVRNIMLVAVTRAPYDKIATFRDRMGRITGVTATPTQTAGSSRLRISGPDETRALVSRTSSSRPHCGERPFR